RWSARLDAIERARAGGGHARAPAGAPRGRDPDRVRARDRADPPDPDPPRGGRAPPRRGARVFAWLGGSPDCRPAAHAARGRARIRSSPERPGDALRRAGSAGYDGAFGAPADLRFRSVRKDPDRLGKY